MPYFNVEHWNLSQIHEERLAELEYRYHKLKIDDSQRGHYMRLLHRRLEAHDNTITKCIREIELLKRKVFELENQINDIEFGKGV